MDQDEHGHVRREQGQGRMFSDEWCNLIETEVVGLHADVRRGHRMMEIMMQHMGIQGPPLDQN